MSNHSKTLHQTTSSKFLVANLLEPLEPLEPHGTTQLYNLLGVHGLWRLGDLFLRRLGLQGAAAHLLLRDEAAAEAVLLLLPDLRAAGVGTTGRVEK